jgi:hypothetical protein
VSSLYLAQVDTAPALGNVEAGAVAQLFSPGISVVSGGLACVVGALLLGATIRAMRTATLDERDDSGDPAGAAQSTAGTAADADGAEAGAYAAAEADGDADGAEAGAYAGAAGADAGAEDYADGSEAVAGGRGCSGVAEGA